jgi:hypothetical protein
MTIFKISLFPASSSPCAESNPPPGTPARKNHARRSS